MIVRQLSEGQEFECVLLVRERELRTGSDGRECLRLALGDRSGPWRRRSATGSADARRRCARTARAVHVQGPLQPA